MSKAFSRKKNNPTGSDDPEYSPTMRHAADDEVKPSPDGGVANIKDLAMKAMSGDGAAVEVFDDFFAQFEHPDKSPLAMLTEIMLIDRIFGNNRTGAFAARLEAHKIRQQLGDREARPLERLMIDRIVCCRLALYDADMSLAAHRNDPEKSPFYEKRADRAQRRYLAAIKALAQVRHLRLPEIHLNLSNATATSPPLDVIDAEVTE